MIDEFTTVSLHGKTVGEDVQKIAKEVNIHHHTRTCKKYDETCRFKFPRYPIHKTIIAQPLKCSSEEKKIKQEKNDEILQAVMKILVDDKRIMEIMNDFNKEEESKAEHQKFIKKRIKKMCKIA